MKNPVFTGAGVAIITPMYEDGSINFDELGRIIEDQIAHHTDAIIICGTTGECSTMTDEEQLAAIKYTVDVVNHRVPVIAGAGSNDTDHGCALAAKSAECGADALLMVTPYYNKTSQAGLVAHFTAMAEAGGIPVIMYNVPSRTGLNIAPETALELSKHPLINGIKEASGNISQVAKIAQLCGDELAFWDLGYWANWEHCARCKALARREGFSEKGFTGYFYYFVRRIHDILARMGKRVILSNDNVDIAVSPDLPRDMLIFWWRTAAPGRGPIEGCTMKRFAEEGFDLFNSFYEETYIDLYMTGEKLADWDPVKRPDCPPEYAYRVKGSCLCAWEGQAHFAWSLPSGIAMMGEKLWDYRDRVYDEAYHQKLTRLLLGPDVPAGLDIFTPLGGCFFPLDGDMPAEKARRGHPDKVDASMLPRLEETMAVLRPFAEGGHRESPLAAVYLECLGWMREQLTNPPADPA